MRSSPSLKSQIKALNKQLEQAGETIAQTQSVMMTQDGEIGRLTALNDRMFAIIDKLITGPRGI